MDDAFINDADIEMNELQVEANRLAWLRKRGICDHGWRKEYPGGKVECLHCHEMFDSWDAAEESRRRNIE